MQKFSTERSERLPDLLVVLAITVVMAAIILPAVTLVPGDEVNAVSKSRHEQVTDGVTAPYVRARASEAEERPEPVLPSTLEAGEAEASDMDVLAEDLDDASAYPARIGQERMRTTDISFVIP